MAALKAKLVYPCNAGARPASDEARTAALANPIGATTNYTTSSASTAPVLTSSQEPSLFPNATGIKFDGSDGLVLSTPYSRTISTAWGLSIAWTNCLNYSDKYLIEGGTDLNHLRFVDASTLEFKGGGSKGTTTTIALNNTDNNSVSYTYGADVEAMIMQVLDTGRVLIYNAKGDKIYESTSAVPGAVAVWGVTNILHDGSYAKNPRMTMVDFVLWEADNTTDFLSATGAANVAAYYTNLQD